MFKTNFIIKMDFLVTNSIYYAVNLIVSCHKNYVGLRFDHIGLMLKFYEIGNLILRYQIDFAP